MLKRPEILFHDEDILIVQKPQNYLTIPDRFKHDLPSVLHDMNHKFGKVWVVNRIDKETSGVLCFAKNEEAHKALSKQFYERTVKKIYWAILDGIPMNKTGIIDKPIAENMVTRGKMIIAKRGKPSITHYEVIEEFDRFALVSAEIKTGRTHQIRVHFQSQGYPLLIDPLYGKRDGFFLSEVKGKKYRINKNSEEKPLMSRTTLHSKSLTLTHPSTGEEMTFESPLPKDFNAVLKQLRKWSK